MHMYRSETILTIIPRWTKVRRVSPTDIQICHFIVLFVLSVAIAADETTPEICCTNTGRSPMNARFRTVIAREPSRSMRTTTPDRGLVYSTTIAWSIVAVRGIKNIKLIKIRCLHSGCIYRNDECSTSVSINVFLHYNFMLCNENL